MADASGNNEVTVEQFYTKSKDAEGDRDMRVRVPGMIAYSIAEMIASGRFVDLRTPQDFIRDAVVHREYELRTTFQFHEMERPFSYWRAQIVEEQISAKREAAKNMVFAIETNLRMARTPAELQEAVERAQLVSFNSDEPYKTDILRAIESARHTTL